MAKDAVATMGSILPDDAGGRDAVHVAVVSAVSDVALRPGQDIGVEHVEGQRDVRAHAVSSTRAGVGKVDPYLTANVKPGQRFWLYLYPRSITGLNHNWSHPAFPDVSTKAPGGIYVNPGAVLASEQWIRRYAEGIGDDYESLMAGADTWANSSDKWGEYYYGPDQGGYHGLFEGVSTHPEFWDHYERIRGVKLDPEKKESFFTCSC